MVDKGYILNYKFEDGVKEGSIKIALKYHQKTKVPAITNLTRVSTPGLRKYAGSTNMPRIINGTVITLSKSNSIDPKHGKTVFIGSKNELLELHRLYW